MALAGALVVLGFSASATGAEPGVTPDVVGPQTADEQRDEPSPSLTTADMQRDRADIPRDRYAMAGGCYGLQDPQSGDWVRKQGSAYVVDAASLADATPIYFQATDLGEYLLMDADGEFLTRKAGVSAAGAPSVKAEWNVTEDFVFGKPGAALQSGQDRALTLGAGSTFTPELREGCAEWPEVEVNVEGQPFAGLSPIQEVRGFIDDHIHQITYNFLGGGVHCGRPWHKYGVTKALRDCPDHIAAGGISPAETILSGTSKHDTGGWPTFEGWPKPYSLTHESVYYKWVERAWRGGQRMFVNLMVENEVLCTVYPNLGDPVATVNKRCKDMATITEQAQAMHDLERYIDAQWGGPGKGWFRIVASPAEARAVINRGKMAVVLGTESSDIFDCSKISAVSEVLTGLGLNAANPLTCTRADIDAGLDKLQDMGVQQMVITHKFDNAFSGVKGDAGTNGIVTNIGNFLQSGSFIKMKQCPEGVGPDNPQLSFADLDPQQAKRLDPLLNVVAGLALPIALPLYPSPPHCNARGLTRLGEYMVRAMAQRNMILDVDHMSARGRDSALDILEELDYPGVISSHSWADPQALPRVYSLGGFVGPYGGGSAGFVDKWQQMREFMDGKYYFGLGFGIDMNGLGPQGEPRGADVANPVTYPFDTMTGVTVDQQVSGEKVYDINTEGVAHYGLLPDWIQDMRQIAGDDIVQDLLKGSEAYLLTWERARGITNDACREPALLRPASDFDAIDSSWSNQDVLAEFGQPHLRRDMTYGYCAEGDASVTVEFDNALQASGTSIS